MDAEDCRTDLSRLPGWFAKLRSSLQAPVRIPGAESSSGGVDGSGAGGGDLPAALRPAHPRRMDGLLSLPQGERADMGTTRTYEPGLILDPKLFHAVVYRST